MSPNYLYQCENCDNEVIQNYSITKSPKVKTCHLCGEHALIRCVGTGCMIKMDGRNFFKEGGKTAT